jgi:DNA integrity scanning protein DisA with diadenylate cyclase activity
MRESIAIYNCRGFPLPARTQAFISIRFGSRHVRTLGSRSGR